MESPRSWSCLSIPQNGSVYSSTDTILSGSRANTGAAPPRPSLALRRPPTAPHTRPLVRHGEGFPLRDRHPRRALPVATGAHIGHLQRYITAHSPTSVLGQENVPRRTRRSKPTVGAPLISLNPRCEAAAYDFYVFFALLIVEWFWNFLGHIYFDDEKTSSQRGRNGQLLRHFASP